MTRLIKTKKEDLDHEEGAKGEVRLSVAVGAMDAGGGSMGTGGRGKGHCVSLSLHRRRVSSSIGMEAEARDGRVRPCTASSSDPSRGHILEGVDVMAVVRPWASEERPVQRNCVLRGSLRVLGYGVS